ncbi:5'-nucleotidase C-terminal domain-containing protein [Peribacillus loiseleuriae]|uniref:5'-nucleotidase C-terminal domain-containing protein n=1 Tax=Peribacillus loiseleuriae TaxID=1679170 RepID=UPI003D023728
MRRNIAFLLAFVLFLSTFGIIQPAYAADAKTTITILHTNDTHAKVTPEDGGMGFAKLSSLVKQLKEKNPKNTLLLDAGDTFHGTPFATLESGESIAKIFNQIGYDGLAAGNHDFNYGFERLLALEKIVNFPILSANVYHTQDHSRLLEPWMIKTVGDIKVGVFGLTTPETTYKTHPKNVEGLTFADPVEEANAMVKELKAEGADIIIALTHLGIDASSTETSIKVAEGAPGIDLIVDGHSHSTLVAGQEAGKDTLIVSAGEYTKNLGVVELTLEGKVITGKKAHLITKEEAENLPDDVDISTLIKDIKKKQEVILSEKIGETDAILEGERTQVRARETNLGNLLSDAMVHATGADAAITNGGGIRASIKQGTITKGNVVDVLPFGNFLVTKKFTGAEMKAALEHGTSDYPNVKGAFPHVSGITFEIDVKAEKGNRVKNLKIAGAPAVMEKEYTVATNDFLASGGDDYTMLKNGPLVNEYGALDEVVIEYIKENSPIKARIENRIVTYLPFTDVSKDGWSHPYIADLYGKDLIKGTSTSTYSPLKNLTRAQFASILVRAFDLKATKQAPFTDLATVAEATQQEIAAAYESGLVKGVNSTTFEPNKSVNRSQMALMIKRAYDWKMENEKTVTKSSEQAVFKDISKLDEETQLAISMAYELEIIQGYGTEYKPYNYATREQAAKVVSKFLAQVE